ncbi:hypothetical protein Daura_25295 [Dactylosporangium aurantiacum]|uniref:Uncharacterized protein n=1 Tax=Dactylosporangium aurantiacum TaxID=35754 RepID=A0A9Q9IVT6_9ACTN|nr:hypothetical protein [Dactylosporangium aurantiacum]MDG6107936.1 hypothetical protein [Dactylosporangium aurantiacum]UWZ60270.1 hypothetical protein Daura_25295 [Dactylosporangium aurantiacum]
MPDWVGTAFHMFVTTWLPGKVQRNAQPVIGVVPVLRIVTSPLKVVPQPESP